MLKKIFMGILSIGLLFMACCKRACDNDAEKWQNQIRVDVAFPIESLDPRYATSATALRISKLIYAPLFTLDNDASPQPLLASSIEAIDDKTFEITLRDGLSFHDDSPLTSEDVIYTYSQLKSDDVASPHAEKFDYVEKIRALDGVHVIFELKEPHAPFTTDLCAIGIVSKKNCEGRSHQCRHENVGSGPFVVKDWDTAKEALTLTPFDRWYEGAPENELLFRVVRDENTRMLELIGQKADLVDGEFSPTNVDELKNYSHLSVVEIPGLGYSYLAINVRGPSNLEALDSKPYIRKKALADPRVRRAIAHAIDFDRIIEKLLANKAKRASGLIPNSHWAKDEMLKPPAFDKDKAERLLDEAGYKRKGPQNLRFGMTIATTQNRMRQSIAQLYADYLKKVGIDAEIRIKDWSALYQDMKSGQFEMFSAIWVPITDPDLYHFVHHSSNIPDEKHGGGNRHGYNNPQVDRLIELGRKTMEQEKRKAIYQEIERIMIRDLPYIPLWNEDRIIVMNKNRIHGFIPSPTGCLLGLRKISSLMAHDKRAGL